ncbi:MAG: hypothetical protein GC206_03040 [Alphaproteobacteria bacterium]|nr:hypothetical protein [Alphaproteobacteria bacterium]
MSVPAARLALALLMLAPAARAGDQNLLGRWRFATAPHPASDCTIEGTADVARGVAANLYVIAIEAEERCPSFGRVARVSERCAGVLSEDALVIRCRLVQTNMPDYAPDHFRLDAVSPTQMSGRLDDERAWDVPVRFERTGADALIS